MSVSAAKKAYRKTTEEMERRRLYRMKYIKRPAVKEADAARKQALRDQPGGDQQNRTRVKADRKSLGRAYITSLLKDQTGVACRDIPEVLVHIKREQILIRRMGEQLANAAHIQRESNT